MSQEQKKHFIQKCRTTIHYVDVPLGNASRVFPAFYIPLLRIACHLLYLMDTMQLVWKSLKILREGIDVVFVQTED